MARLLNLRISLLTAVFAVVALGLAIVLFTDGGANRSATATVASVSAPTGGASRSSSPPSVKEVTSSSTPSATSVYSSTHLGVVSILSTSNNDSSPVGSSGNKSTALGSGILLDDKGDILTNEHVVDKATK